MSPRLQRPPLDDTAQLTNARIAAVLAEIADLRGDCHSHSHWSDGREPLEVMVESARRDGREYQVLSDHSGSLTIANGLGPDRVE